MVLNYSYYKGLVQWKEVKAFWFRMVIFPLIIMLKNLKRIKGQ